MIKIQEIITIIFIVVLVAAAAGIFFMKNIKIDERLLVENNLFQEKVMNKKIDEKLSRAKEERDGLEESVENLLAKAKVLSAELVTYKNKISSQTQQLSRLKSQVNFDQKGIKNKNSNISDLKIRVATTLKDKFKLSDGVTLLEKTTDALRARFAELFKDSDTVADSSSNAEVLKDLGMADGEVLTVNREFSFLVVSLGRKDAIAEEALLTVVRDNNILGQVKVETVRENISAAALIDKSQISRMRAGDKIFLEKRS